MLIYQIFMPAGHEDWLGNNMPLASTSDFDDMMHYVEFYHFGRHEAVFSNPEGPIYVKEVKDASS